ncbi:nucleotidyltransferase domain-containing protein [Candidatus Woesearchaeota archaeon]|nr:nucleotidyltransferase domain-containing protein [Candidatus Woesearchaeota archaeon]
MNAKKILDEVLADIKPKKRTIKEVDEFVGEINSQIKKSRISAKAVVGGSFAKNTFLKEDHDVDIFVLFSLKYSNENLSRLLKKILKPFKTEQVHGSRDYFIIKNKFNFEIVPVLDIKKAKNAQNVTDFSPEHVKWFNKNGKKYADDIRLAKKFCKANKIYGAESYINGFSGHVLDILIVHYKGFLPLMRAASKWKKKQVIDFYNVHRGKALFELNKSKTQGSLVVVDPVQPDRNAAAALDEEKFGLFVKNAKEFLKKPSKMFFTEKKADREKLMKNGYILIEAVSKKGKEDVSGAKLLKAFDFVKKGLEEFEVCDAGWEWDKKKNALFWYLAKKKKLPESVEWQGPPLIMENRVKDFRKKYRKTFTKKGRIFAKITRKHTTPESLAKELIKDRYFRERVKKCRKL